MIRKLSVVAVMIAAACTFSSAALAGPPTPKGEGTVGSGSIAAGYVPAAGEWPWVTAIMQRSRGGTNSNQTMCTGTLVTQWHILTADALRRRNRSPGDLCPAFGRRTAGTVESDAGVELRNVAATSSSTLTTGSPAAGALRRGVITWTGPSPTSSPPASACLLTGRARGVDHGLGAHGLPPVRPAVFPRYLQAGVFETAPSHCIAT